MRSKITKTAEGFAVEFVNASFGYKTVHSVDTAEQAQALVSAKKAESQDFMDQVLTINEYFYGVK